MQLLASLFSTEERYRINTEARKWLQEMVPEGTANPERWIEQVFPTDRPNWDVNTEEEKIQLDRYQMVITQGLKRGDQRLMDMSKLAGIVHKGNESPSEFCKRLCEAYRLYTPIDPEATGSQIVINSAFTSQACPDIQQTLQKTEGVLPMSSPRLIEIADKVFWNRDKEIEKKYEKRYKDEQRRTDERFAMLAAALGKSSEDFSSAQAKKPPLASRSGQPSNWSQRRLRAALQPNQCAQCRGFGHWKNECPEGRRENKSLPVAELTNIETE